MWVGIVGPQYAPEVSLVGVAAIAPAIDMVKTVALDDGRRLHY